MTLLFAGRLAAVYAQPEWRAPVPYGQPGDGGYCVTRADRESSVIVSTGIWAGSEWIHASIAHADRMPTYEDLTTLRAAVFGDRWAIQVFAPPSQHISIHSFALHLWGRADGARVHPNFGVNGSI